MYMKGGIWVKGPPPRQGQPPKKAPKIIKHRSQQTPTMSRGSRMDALLAGEARICVYRNLGGLGDILMATPIAKGAKKKYPKCHVTYAVDTKYANGGLLALLENNPYIDEIIDYTLFKREDYDVYGDITRVGLPEEKPYTIPPNRIDLFAQSMGIPLFGDFLPTYIVTEEERQDAFKWMDRNLNGINCKALIAVHTRSNDPKRTWPKQNVMRFVDLARRSGYHCLIFGWGDPRDEWNLAGSTRVFDFPTRKAAAILDQCDVLVCPDSMMLHLGGALSMKMVSIFGAMPPACRINHYQNAVAVVNTQLACLGCIYSQCDKNFMCMQSVTEQQVLQSVEKQLESELKLPGESNKEITDTVSPIKRRVKSFQI